MKAVDSNLYMLVKVNILTDRSADRSRNSFFMFLCNKRENATTKDTEFTVNLHDWITSQIIVFNKFDIAQLFLALKIEIDSLFKTKKK